MKCHVVKPEFAAREGLYDAYAAAAGWSTAASCHHRIRRTENIVKVFRRLEQRLDRETAAISCAGVDRRAGSRRSVDPARWETLLVDAALHEPMVEPSVFEMSCYSPYSTDWEDHRGSADIGPSRAPVPKVLAPLPAPSMRDSADALVSLRSPPAGAHAKRAERTADAPSTV
jgi:hypothetical protein